MMVEASNRDRKQINLQYESLIQKLEEDVRQNIRKQHQFKLHIESLENKLDSQNTLASEFKKKNGTLEIQNHSLEKMIKNMDQNIKTLEQRHAVTASTQSCSNQNTRGNYSTKDGMVVVPVSQNYKQQKSSLRSLHRPKSALKIRTSQKSSMQIIT